MSEFYGLNRVNIPDYAHIKSATVSTVDMGMFQIDAEVGIDPGIAPDFSEDWALEFQGEKYIHPSKKPEAEKGTDSLYSTVKLQFYHEAIIDLRRYWFVDVVTLDSGKVVADKFVVQINLTLPQFVDLLGKVLNYYFGDKITCTLSEAAAARASQTPFKLDISYTYIWDLLQKVYEYYTERWVFKNGASAGKYVIEIGAEATEISHIFEYGFNGGLMKVTRQPQSQDIKNKMFGRGGDKNLPVRYFKDVDSNNPNFRGDPDWIPELRFATLDKLRGRTFRSYVQGWKTNPNRQLKEADGTSITPYPHDSTVSAISALPYDSQRGATDEPYRRGHTDEVFDPIEFVKDDESIAKYGELWTGIDNEDIYPTIQGLQAGWGDLNKAFGVEQVKSDDVENAAANDAKLLDLPMAKGTSPTPIKATQSKTVTIRVPNVRVEAGKTGVFSRGTYNLSVYSPRLASWWDEGARERISKEIVDSLEVTHETVKAYKSGSVVDENPGGSVNLSGGTTGATYDVEVIMTVRCNLTENPNGLSDGFYVTATLNSPKLTTATPGTGWKNTFDIWIGEIWGEPRNDGETDDEYTQRVWLPILGDANGCEAAVIFLSGNLAASEDYEFKIASVAYDSSKSLTKDGFIFPSAWRLTLGKSDADLETLGVYVPSTKRQGNKGDLIAFVNVELPHKYVTGAEERLDAYKEEQLDDVADIKPSWGVEVDNVRLNQLQQGEAQTLASQIKVGAKVLLADKRFITDAPTEGLYLQSVTYEFNQDSLFPKISMTLSNEVAAVSNPVSTIQGDISAIYNQLGAIGSVERLVRTVGDKIYLRKDGIVDRSISPTQFDSLVSSSDFRQGFVGGQGFGIYRDGNGRTVFEGDRMVLRETLHVNTFAVNEVTALGGKLIWTAASMRVTSVESVMVNDTNPGYRCYFDRKGGSVQNQFVSGDIAYCERFDPSLATQKIYKAVVFDIGDDYIDIYAGGSSTYYGAGIPSEGDSIAQFGNTSDTDRQYAIIVDVIGGGYTRFLKGLNSVTSQGKEYGFFGRQTTQGERVFIGDNTDGYFEYKNGKVTILGDFHVKSASGASTPLAQYVNTLISSGLESSRNLVLNTNRGALGVTVNSGLSEMKLADAPKGVFSADAVEITRGDAKAPSSDYEIVLYDFRPELIVQGKSYSVSFDYAIIGSNGAQFKIQPSITKIDGSGTLLYFAPQPLTAGNESGHFFAKSSGAATASGPVGGGQRLYLNFSQGRGQWSKLYIWNMRVGEGLEDTPWSPAPEDVDLRFGYLTKAFENDTSISGGLIQSSLVRLGYRDAQGQFVPMAGMSGIGDQTKPGGGIAIFAGGDIIDKTEDAANGAMSVIRQDGTAYFSGNTVRMLESSMEIGDALTANANGLFMSGSDGTPLSVQNKPIGISVESIAQALNPVNVTRNETFGYMWEQHNDAGVVVPYPGFSRQIGQVTCGSGETLTATASVEVNRQTAATDRFYVVVKLGESVVYSGLMSRVSYTAAKSTLKCPIPNLQNQSESSATYDIYFASNPSGDDTQPSGSIGGQAPSGVTPVVTYLSGQWNGSVVGTHSVVVPNQTKLGSDGFGAVWGQTAFFVKEGDVLMRTGVHGFRVTQSGCMFTDDGMNWHPIDFSSIQTD